MDRKDKRFPFHHAYKVNGFVSEEELRKSFDGFEALNEESGGGVSLWATQKGFPNRTIFHFGSHDGKALMRFVLRTFGDCPKPDGYRVIHSFGKDRDDEWGTDWCHMAKIFLEKERVPYTEKPVERGDKRAVFYFHRRSDSLRFRLWTWKKQFDPVVVAFRERRKQQGPGQVIDMTQFLKRSPFPK